MLVLIDFGTQQLITPIICLGLVYIIQLIMKSQFKNTTYSGFDIPVLVNEPFVSSLIEPNRSCLIVSLLLLAPIPMNQ